MAGFFSKLDDEVNDSIGWEGVAAIVAAMFGMPTGGFGAETGGAGGFSWLPSGEMTVSEGAGALGGSGGGTNFLSGLFGGGSELAPVNPTDYSRIVDMYPTSSGNIFEPAGMSPTQISSIQGMGDSALTQQMARQGRMPNFGSQMNQQNQQNLAGLNQEFPSGGIKKGQAIPQAVLASLLDPANALKVYRPTLI